RRASRQQEQTYQEIRDALPQSLNSIQAREIRVVPNAFNSTPAFLTYFQAAALGSIPLVLLDLASAIKRVGASLDGIRSELAIANVAKVQGWDNGGFGAYVHRFVQNEMAASTERMMVNTTSSTSGTRTAIGIPHSKEDRQKTPLVLRLVAIIIIL
ncbi:hypothetical protein BFJ71_g17722, partial [Fusarium oxysporum]